MIGMFRSVVAAGLVLVSAAALADDRSDCLDGIDHELRIKGCSEVIQRNPRDAVAYHNRAEAYSVKGDIDRAISDYTKAIVLDPNYAPAYNGRGRAYVSKGDYVRAVDDVTRAGELTRKERSQPAVVKPAPSKDAVKAAPTKVKEAPSPALVVPGTVTQKQSTRAKPAGAGAPSAVGKAPVADQPSSAGKAATTETPSAPGKAPVAEKSSVAGKAVDEKPSEGSWPAWAKSKLSN
jgi:tetratricopeptide (TPR) repeat protein